MLLSRKRACAGVIAASMIAASASLIVSATQAGAGAEFTLTAHTTNIQIVTQRGSFVPSGPPPSNAPLPAPGDRFLLRDELSQGGAVVGFSNIVCTVTFNNNLLCDAIYALSGRGDIHLTALVRGGALNEPAVFDAVIDGGTFNFRGLHGDVHIVNLPNGDTQETFNLT
ncbi:MAG: hypothetical protein NVS3B21_23120 [Acidimicrobiales bacterium]